MTSIPRMNRSERSIASLSEFNDDLSKRLILGVGKTKKPHYSYIPIIDNFSPIQGEEPRLTNCGTLGESVCFSAFRYIHLHGDSSA